MLINSSDSLIYILKFAALANDIFSQVSGFQWRIVVFDSHCYSYLCLKQ